MKYIITEDQLNKVKEKILKLRFSVFNNDWDLLQEFLKRRGNPHYILTDNVNLYKNKKRISLGNLISVEGHLDLRRTSVQSLGGLISVGGNLNLVGTQIKSFGKLTSVGGDLSLTNTSIESFGNLTSIGGNLGLNNTPISKEYTKQQIRDMVQVNGNIYL